MEIEVGNLRAAKEKVDEQIKKLNGYTQGEYFSNEETREMVRMKIRIPHENFDALVNSCSKEVGTVISKNTYTEDASEEYTDIALRLQNKMTYLEKYRDLLKKSASTKDLMEIQEKIRGLEEEIEAAEGRLRFIDDKVKYSSLELVLFREKARNAVTSKIGFGSRFMDSLAIGWNIFIGFLLGLVSFWPFFILLPLIIVLFRRWKRRKVNHK